MDESQKPKGMRLGTLLIVIAIIGVPAGLLLPRLIIRHPIGPSTLCGIQLRKIASALEQFRSDYGAFPTNSAVIPILVGNNPLKRVYLNFPQRSGSSPNEFLDPWGTPYRVEILSETNFLVRSAAMNQKFGDEDDRAVDSSGSNLSQQQKP